MRMYRLKQMGSLFGGENSQWLSARVYSDLLYGHM